MLLPLICPEAARSRDLEPFEEDLPCSQSEISKKTGAELLTDAWSDSQPPFSRIELKLGESVIWTNVVSNPEFHRFLSKSHFSSLSQKFYFLQILLKRGFPLFSKVKCLFESCFGVAHGPATAIADPPGLSTRPTTPCPAPANPRACPRRHCSSVLALAHPRPHWLTHILSHLWVD